MTTTPALTPEQITELEAAAKGADSLSTALTPSAAEQAAPEARADWETSSEQSAKLAQILQIFDRTYQEATRLED